MPLMLRPSVRSVCASSCSPLELPWYRTCGECVQYRFEQVFEMEACLPILVNGEVAERICAIIQVFVAFRCCYRLCELSPTCPMW